MSEQAKQLQERAQHSAKLQETLELEGSPVAVAIMREPPDDLKQWEGKAFVCIMIQSARRGNMFYCSGDNIFCSGRAYIGIGELPIPNIEDFLCFGEKLYASRAAARRRLELFMELAPKLGGYAAFSPLEKANFDPDVVLFVGTPFQIMRILFLDVFETGMFDTVHGEPVCSAAIATPITTGRAAVSFLDVASRRFGKYKPEEMVVAVPYERLSRIVASIDRSIAGTAEPDGNVASKILNAKVPF